MKKLCMFVGMILFGWLGGWIGAKLGGFTIGFLTGGFGSMVGVWAGWRIYRDYLD